MTDLTKFDPIEAGLSALREKHQYTAEELDAKLILIDGEKEVKAAKKELTATRSAIAAAHKAAKAPILEASRALDGKKKSLESAIKEIEKPIDEAIKRKKDKEQAEKDAELAALKEKLAEAEAALKANGITEPQFVEQQVDITIRTKAQLTALGKIIGEDNVKALKFDDEGQAYVLGLLVRRKEVQSYV
jgi:DNA repair exonuclease SbcCD ATPase subunit